MSQVKNETAGNIMKYIIREIEPKDNASVENIIRTCLLEYGGNMLLSADLSEGFRTPFSI